MYSGPLSTQIVQGFETVIFDEESDAARIETD